MQNATPASPTDPASFIPWKWQVKPDSPSTVSCPSATSILGTFAAINVAVSLLGLGAGHRVVVKKLSFGYLGKRGSKSWRYSWLWPLALQLGANAIVAAVIKHTAGYHRGFAITDLLVFYTARPRLSWITVMMISGWHKPKVVKKGKDTANNTLHLEPLMECKTSNTATQHLAKNNNPEDAPEYEDDYYYRSAAMAQFIAEIILEMIAMSTMVKTFVFARRHGYYFLGHLHGSTAQNARIMYAGALFYIIGFSLTLFWRVFLLIPLIFSRSRGDVKPYSSTRFFAFVALPFSWTASWVFWIGFVRLAGDL
jgi:hypothetical protein